MNNVSHGDVQTPTWMHDVLMCELQGVITIMVCEALGPHPNPNPNPSPLVIEPGVRIMRQLELPLTDTEDLSTPAGVGNRAGGHSHA